MSGSHNQSAPEATQYDLRPPVTHEEVDALRLQLTQGREAREYLTGRVASLEAHVEALESAVSQHADVLQAYRLREGV